MPTLYKTIVKDFKAKKLDFRMNDLDDSLEIKTPDGKWDRITDTLEAVVNLSMREIGYSSKLGDKPSLTAFQEGVITYANQNRHNPITAYLAEAAISYQPGKLSGDNIPQPYLIRQFADRFFENPDNAFPLWLFRWMVGCVARARTGTRNPMLVLTGEQEKGKSYFSEWLCSGLSERFNRGGILPDNKDHKIRQAVLFLWEVDELAGTTTRRNADALKSFISLTSIFERFPFGKKPLKKLCRCSFIGTANFDGSGILNDPTGSTRFLLTEINRIDWDYATEYQPNHLWGEAAYFASRFPQAMKLSKKENTRRKEINARYEVHSALGEVIENLFEFTGKEADFMTTQEIQDLASSYFRISNSQAFYNELARVMRSNGIERGKSPHSRGGKRGWIGIKPG